MAHVYGSELSIGTNGNYNNTNPATTSANPVTFRVSASGDITTVKSITLAPQDPAPAAADGKMFYYDGAGMQGEGLYFYYGGSWRKVV